MPGCQEYARGSCGLKWGSFDMVEFIITRKVEDYDGGDCILIGAHGVRPIVMSDEEFAEFKTFFNNNSRLYYDHAIIPLLPEIDVQSIIEEGREYIRLTAEKREKKRLAALASAEQRKKAAADRARKKKEEKEKKDLEEFLRLKEKFGNPAGQEKKFYEPT